MARPIKELDKEQFEKLCALQCTYTEICTWFDITDKTLNSWCKKTYSKSFSDIFKRKREKGRISLRRTIWQHAENSVPAAIFLCKNYLGMSDNPNAIEVKASMSQEDAEKIGKMFAEQIKNIPLVDKDGNKING